MKKSLIALAVLATTGAAFAQSSVTLYGRLDASIGQTTTETKNINTGAVTVAKNKQTLLDQSQLNSTFWGLRGVEDLGGGLKAVFKLESRFGVDSGAAAAGNTLFEREANVGIDGGFGSLKLGRLPTTYDDFQAVSNSVFNSNFRTRQDVSAFGVADYSSTVSNSIKYISPDMSGFTVAATYSLGENKKTAATVLPGSANPTTAANNTEGSATDILSLGLRYVAGPMAVVYAHQEEKLAQALVTPAQVTNKFDLIGGSYDFGVAKVVADYTTAKNGTRKDDGYQIGVYVPVGAFTFAAGYTDQESKGAGLATLNGTGYSLVGTYDLSKRTTLYAGYENTKIEGGVTGAITEAKRSNFSTGVRHTF